MKTKWTEDVDAAARELIRLGFVEEFEDENGKGWRLTEAGRARADRDRREEELRQQVSPKRAT